MSISLNIGKVREIENLKLQAERDEALQGITYDLGGGRIMQVRPQDIGNLQTAIANGRDRRWKMADNTIHMVTVAEFQAAYAYGISTGEAIWDDHMDAVDAL